jgi:DNA polymerase-3 subunit epsilon
VPALAVHALRTADLAGAPALDAVVDHLIELLSGRVLVAHAAWVERAFLNRALRSRGARLPRATVDTAALLRACHLTAPGRTAEPNLEASSRRLGLPVHTPHHALGDAFTTAQLFLALATRLDTSHPGKEPRPLTVGRLCAISRRHRL